MKAETRKKPEIELETSIRDVIEVGNYKNVTVVYQGWDGSLIRLRLEVEVNMNNDETIPAVKEKTRLEAIESVKKMLAALEKKRYI
jgi:hypothetical protein